MDIPRVADRIVERIEHLVVAGTLAPGVPSTRQTDVLPTTRKSCGLNQTAFVANHRKDHAAI